MLSLNAIALSHGARTLFADVSLRVVPGDRIALVGPNGAGKTTLLDIIIGDQVPDEGEVSLAKEARIGFLRQEVAETRGRSVLEEVLGDDDGARALEARLRELEARMTTAADDDQEALLAEYADVHERFEHLGGYGVEAEAQRVLGGLGFDDAQIARDVGELSGGWMMRVALARLLLSRPDILLLDEPTNHLDLASVDWLESFLSAYEGAIILVSHDRDFINGMANKVVELAFGRLTEYVGNYEKFVEQRATSRRRSPTPSSSSSASATRPRRRSRSRAGSRRSRRPSGSRSTRTSGRSCGSASPSRRAAAATS
jgi:ATP-binding cassette, subfamily F, member 3